MVLFLSAIAALCGGCATDALRDYEIPVKAPFSRASVYGSRLYVRLISGAALTSAVTIPLGHLRGGMTLDEAVLALGQPVATRRDPRGTYFSFGRGDLDPELAHLQFRDSGNVDKWVLQASPKDARLAAVLSPELLELMNRIGGISEIIVHELGRPQLQAFSATVASGRLSNLEWYSIEGIPGE